MNGYVADIEDRTCTNSDFRQVPYTGKNLQLALMALKPGQDIGLETLTTHDQFFRIERGKGQVWIDDEKHKVKASDAMVVPAGAAHNLKNTGKKQTRLYTIYGPPNHLDQLDQLDQRTKSEAVASTEHFEGNTTE